jgi:transcriptional regulator with XRE-family HTH domain
MHISWKELKAQTMTARERKRARTLTQRDIAQMKLRELRSALRMTQSELARKLKSTQVAVSRLERRKDMRLSTLQDYAKGLGGELEIYVSFPGRKVRLTGAHSHAKAPRSRIRKVKRAN